MITAADIELLRGLTKKAPSLARLAGGKNSFALLYSRWFVLELPATMFDPALTDWEEAHDAAAAWRNVIPPGEGEYAQATRWTNPEDNVPLIKLIAGSASALIHTSIYEVVMKKLPEPEFRVFVGDKPYVAILSAGSLVGGAGQVKV